MAERNEPTYVVHYRGGQRSRPMASEQVRALIESGRVGIEDRVSRGGGPPVEFYHYEEFVDLWDVDESFAFLGEDDEPTPADPLPKGPSAPRPAAVVAAPRPAEEADPVAFFEDDPDALFDFDELDEGAAVADTETEANVFASLGDSAGWDTAVSSSAMVAGLPDFEGYDPLADLLLDPMTVLDLLYDSSLYTVLAANPSEGGETLEARYMARAALLAKRARKLGRADPEQVAATESLRRLIYRAYTVLVDPDERSEYLASSKRGGRLATAETYLSLTTSPVEEPDEEVLFEVDDLDQQAPSALPADDREDMGERAAHLGLSDDYDSVPDTNDPFGIREELLTPAAGQARALRRAVDFSDEHDPYDGPFPSPEGPRPEGVRVYSSIVDAIDSRTLDDLEPVADIFTEDVPREARLRRERLRRQRTGHSSAVRTSADFVVGEKDHPPGLRWGTGPAHGPAAGQAIGTTAVAFFVSLVVVFVTDQGAGELDFNGNTWWFYGRGLLLVSLAAVGTMALRGEPITRLGLMPPFLETALAIGLGVVIGLLGSYVAPIYLDPSGSVGVAVLSMLFIAIAHEAFFRGFVTRVLLVGMREPYAAIAVSCLLYGLFYLSYSAVLGQQGFYVLFYSVFLYGFGLGSIYAVLYWKSHSIWPSVLMHTLVLMLAMLLAPN